MNYRHSYHAGNFADVLKHAIFVVLLQAMQRKETPFCVLDTHAGIGMYSLQSEAAQKKQEYENGIAKLYEQALTRKNGALSDYLAYVKALNTNDALEYYPGSPAIAHHFLREQDQLILCELHPDDNATLKHYFYENGNHKSVAVHHTDAYLAMKAFLPPKQKRGLVLIDPPFEVTNEFEQMSDAIKRTLKHWRGGNMMIWYPIKNMAAVNTFYREIKTLDAENMMIEFALQSGVEAGKLSACGIVLINPPWQVREMLTDDVLPVLASALDAKWQIK